MAPVRILLIVTKGTVVPCPQTPWFQHNVYMYIIIVCLLT